MQRGDMSAKQVASIVPTDGNRRDINHSRKISLLWSPMKTSELFGRAKMEAEPVCKNLPTPDHHPCRPFQPIQLQLQYTTSIKTISTNTTTKITTTT
jgi:hypothetical protein